MYYTNDNWGFLHDSIIRGVSWSEDSLCVDVELVSCGNACILLESVYTFVIFNLTNRNTLDWLEFKQVNEENCGMIVDEFINASGGRVLTGNKEKISSRLICGNYNLFAFEPSEGGTILALSSRTGINVVPRGSVRSC